MDALEAHLQRQIEHSRNFFWHRVRWKAVKRELRQESFTLTDVGAGIGLLGDFLARDFPRVSYRFVEPLESLVEDLEARFGQAANANDAPAYAESAYITLLDVLEHIEDDDAFLEELTTKMAVGSTLIMTVPALRRLWSQWDVALGHHRRYDRPMIDRLFADGRLQLRSVSYLFPEMLIPALVRRRQSGNGSSERAEFPDLSSPMNTMLLGLGSATLRLKRLWPAGTSLLVVAERT